MIMWCTCNINNRRSFEYHEGRGKVYQHRPLNTSRLYQGVSYQSLAVVCTYIMFSQSHVHGELLHLPLQEHKVFATQERSRLYSQNTTLIANSLRTSASRRIVRNSHLYCSLQYMNSCSSERLSRRSRLHCSRTIATCLNDSGSLFSKLTFYSVVLEDEILDTNDFKHA